jgi:hypothetical protein
MKIAVVLMDFLAPAPKTPATPPCLDPARPRGRGRGRKTAPARLTPPNESATGTGSVSPLRRGTTPAPAQPTPAILASSAPTATGAVEAAAAALTKHSAAHWPHTPMTEVQLLISIILPFLTNNCVVYV